MKNNEKKKQAFLKMNSEKIMKNFLLETEIEFNEEKANEIIGEVEVALKRNLISVYAFS